MNVACVTLLLHSCFVHVKSRGCELPGSYLLALCMVYCESAAYDRKHLLMCTEKGIFSLERRSSCLSVFLSCRDLLDRDTFSKSDPCKFPRICFIDSLSSFYESLLCTFAAVILIQFTLLFQSVPSITAYHLHSNVTTFPCYELKYLNACRV